MCAVSKKPGPAWVIVRCSSPSRSTGVPSASVTSPTSRTPSWPKVPARHEDTGLRSPGARASHAVSASRCCQHPGVGGRDPVSEVDPCPGGPGAVVAGQHGQLPSGQRGGERFGRGGRPAVPTTRWCVVRPVASVTSIPASRRPPSYQPSSRRLAGTAEAGHHPTGDVVGVQLGLHRGVRRHEAGGALPRDQGDRPEPVHDLERGEHTRQRRAWPVPAGSAQPADVARRHAAGRPAVAPRSPRPR